MTPEGRLMRQIMVALSEAGHRIVRVNAGKGWVGPSRRHPDGSVTIKAAQPFHGVPEGVSDLIGCAKDGAFLAVEVKVPGGVTSPAQSNYIAMIAKLGGRAGVAYSVSDALEIAGGAEGRSTSTLEGQETPRSR